MEGEEEEKRTGLWRWCAVSVIARRKHKKRIDEKTKKMVRGTGSQLE